MSNEQKSKDRSVLYVSAGIALVFVAFSIILPSQMAKTSNGVLSFLTTNFGWLYLLSVFIFTIFIFVIALSRYGKIKLGKDDEKPEFTTFQWFTMLFGGGMGIGMVFWSIAEPMMHYAAPPVAKPGTPQAMHDAMRIVFNDFGIHVWIIYGVCGLALGYFQYRKGLPCLISSAFYPILGEKGIRGPIGKTIDVIAVFATMFGVATSLGLGAGQIATGMQYIWGIKATPGLTAIVIAVMTVIFTLATVSGLHKGLQAVADIKIWLSIGFMVFIFLFGGMVFILNTFTHTLGDYLQNFIGQSMWMGNIEWTKAWPVFYRAWYIAWAGFVGQFIARVSRGRTIREFILASVFLPSGFCFIWLAIYGGAAFNLDAISNGAISAAVKNDISTALFVTLQQMPLYAITAPLALILIITSFAGAANSATYVLSMLTSGGDENPSKKLCGFWGIAQGGITIMLILVGGTAAIKTLQTASIAAAFPFMLIMLAMCYTIFKALKEEKV
ncbi:glycine/betaine ABC transporter permease [Clostridium carboxidivorans P7]|uniref:Choline/carnitine/betaine transporter n=1 Tax=Clostridium carboxidivorans P7 TaxID=536227 RepID=C6Q2Z7_9CLOT|nr:BCCT family transporter [Clostridium carboxidivorans]AKN30117.1 glycine/betaine ABC transporter permease [Clostridium carboxidivorans P7]EET84133.1 choline/carnitine/betaine transporter [Clostridium carboxidivorans P7]EFG86083.1 transporter, betaine/carnitine/choline transporter (BCCT) family protein [Clostridium carboxidivorans P7]